MTERWPEAGSGAPHHQTLPHLHDSLPPILSQPSGSTQLMLRKKDENHHRVEGQRSHNQPQIQPQHQQQGAWDAPFASRAEALARLLQCRSSLPCPPLLPLHNLDTSPPPSPSSGPEEKRDEDGADEVQKRLRRRWERVATRARAVVGTEGRHGRAVGRLLALQTGAGTTTPQPEESVLVLRLLARYDDSMSISDHRPALSVAQPQYHYGGDHGAVNDHNKRQYLMQQQQDSGSIKRPKHEDAPSSPAAAAAAVPRDLSRPTPPPALYPL